MNACTEILWRATGDGKGQQGKDEKGSSDYGDGDLAFQHHLQFESCQIL